MFKSNLSENAKKRINILKNSNDGFEISEEDMKLEVLEIFLVLNKVVLKILN